MWLARNKDGKLFIWRIRPIKIGGKWGLGIDWWQMGFRNWKSV